MTSALDSLFRPRSVAVIGASNGMAADGSRKLGTAAFAHLLEHGFAGRLYPVNPRETQIMGQRCYASVDGIAGPIDLAIIVLPAQACVQALRQCGAKGIRAAIVMSSGFAEAGNAGLQDELVRAARESGIRFVGPNTAGFVCMESSLVASISMVCAMNPLRAGGVAFVTQSGAMGGSLLGRAMEEGVGFSHWITVGNEADLDTADYIDALADDPAVRVIALFLEGVRSGTRFLRACARAADAAKPIVVYKSGVSAVGAQATLSHTGALAGSHRVFAAMCRQHGLTEVDDVTDLLPLAGSFAWIGERLPFDRTAGRRVGIVSASGGICGVAADECERFELEVPALAPATQQKIRNVVPDFASVRNPVDVTGQIRVSPTGYQDTVQAVLADEAIDAVLLLVTMAAEPRATFYGREIGAISRAAAKPVLVTWAGPRSLASRGYPMLLEQHVPVFESPRAAVRALKALVDYGRFVRRRQHQQAGSPAIPLPQTQEATR